MIKINNRYIKLFILIICLISLFAFQKTNFITVKNTVNTFFSSVLPSLFPFILFSNFALNSNLLSAITSNLKKYKYITSAIIIGFLCGYPMGAKTTSKYYTEGYITKNQALFLMSFINNCNPIFILSTIGLCVFNNLYIGIILCISHYLSAIIIGISYFTHNNIIHENIKKSNELSKKNNKKLHKSIFQIVDESIKTSYIVLSNIFAFILIFSLVFSVLENILLKIGISNQIICTISALFEVTSGCKSIFLNSNLNIKYIICLISFMLGFSGFSIIFQIYSCIYTCKIKLLHIIKYKFIQAILSMLITYIIISLNTNFGTYSINLIKFSSTSYFIILATILFLITYSIKKVTQK